MAAGIGAIVIGAGIYIVAASIGHQVFAVLFDKLWGGGGAARIAFDPSQAVPSQGVVALDQMPFGLRLVASSALFLGVAFFVALCELFWLHTRDRLAQVRELLAEADLIISKYDEAGEAKIGAIKAEQEFRMTQDDDYKKAFAHAKVIEGKQGWRNAVEGQRPNTTNIAKLSQEQYQGRKEAASRIEAAIAVVDTMEATQIEQVQDLIDRLMVKPLQKAAKTASTTAQPAQEQE